MSKYPDIDYEEKLEKALELAHAKINEVYIQNHLPKESPYSLHAMHDSILIEDINPKDLFNIPKYSLIDNWYLYDAWEGEHVFYMINMDLW